MTLHTDIPTHTEVERLLAERDGPVVSIYIPTTRSHRMRMQAGSS